MREVALEELVGLREEVVDYEKEVALMLLPKDKMDGVSAVIMEIRAGASHAYEVAGTKPPPPITQGDTGRMGALARPASRYSEATHPASRCGGLQARSLPVVSSTDARCVCLVLQALGGMRRACSPWISSKCVPTPRSAACISLSDQLGHTVSKSHQSWQYSVRERMFCWFVRGWTLR